MKQQPAVFSMLDTSAMGGAETYLLSNLIFLAERGHPVILATNCQAVKEAVVAQSLPSNTTFTLVDLPFRLDAIGNWKGLVKFWLLSPYAVYWLFRLKRRYLNQYSQVTCLLPGFSDRLFFSPWLKQWGYRLLWLEYGPLEPTFARNFGFPRWLYSKTKHLADQILTISHTTQRSLITTGQIGKDKISIIYPGVNIPSAVELRRWRKQAAAWRTHHQLQNTSLIVAIGRIATEKEFAVLISAFRVLCSNLPKQQQPHLVIVGDGPERTKLEALIARLRIGQHVTLTGFVDEDEKSVLLSTAQLFVFPSAWPLEGFGMTTIEAMSFQVPVITTGAGPQAEIITDLKEGLHFKPRNSTDLAQKMQTMLSNKTLSRSLSRHAYDKAKNTFSERHMHAQISDLI